MSEEEVPSVSKKSKLSANDAGKLKKSKNIVHMMQKVEILGQAPRSIEELPEDLFESTIFESTIWQYETLPTNVLKLRKYSQMQKIDLSDESFNDILEQILDPFLAKNDSGPNAKCFNYLGGIEVLADILVQAFLEEGDDIGQVCEVTTITNDVDHSAVRTIMQIMHNCTQTCVIGISHLCERPRLLHLLFSFLADVETYIDATILLEEILMSDSWKGVIKLREIKCLPSLLEKPLAHQQQAHIYRIISLVIDFNPSMNSSLAQHDRLLMTSDSVQINKDNQEFLVNLDIFIDQLFNIACWNASFNRDNVIIRNIIDSLMARISTVSRHYFTEELLAQNYYRMLENGEHNHILEIGIHHEKPIRADAFHLLSMLLAGCCREKMQQLIVEKDLIRRLEETLEAVVWKNVREEAQQSHEDHMFEPNSVLKIHFLRFLHSVSDHHLHRYLLLGQDDLEEMEMLAGVYDVPMPPDFDKFDQSKCCRKSGYLTQVVDKLKLEPQDSFIRFWMARALESFLRGPTCFIDQIFLMKRNLVEDLLSLLLSPHDIKSEVIQGNFDLLASLMKENIHAFERFNKVVDCTDSFKILMRRIEQNVVDSNMFVRCAIITLHYMHSVKSEHRDFIPECRILKYYSTSERRIEVVMNLIETLVPSTLSQENVSCLNTGIIIFLIAKANNELEKYLSIIANKDIEFSCRGRTVLSNLRCLLCFWMEHYSLPFKLSDCKSLEEGSGFSFNKWKNLVSQLIDRDVTSSCSILHYISSST